jgi:hypothetical protein
LVTNSPFDELRANGQAFSFALSSSKGSLPKTAMHPQLAVDPNHRRSLL